ncbi:TetR/AcrR family transcriptional regulator [Leptothoe spongobia]|uniref:TetR/AcrR family transcriptional regulator n=1 Tax=Leptothoe spongobia TAU-MAC 1115 TaxID=1967444 RepID=A0A947DIV6_9CYAN|nr:TetR/AcrR family transcriptional regulator [Leptothoe spongobia]MBT9317825.1 TetR/AcrR family transcriptional regulator [Leptothoe spongobia TAU-MAC 1115]
MNETEAKIIEAAIRTFVRYGAKKTSMADIASAAGVSRQTLYDLFGNKDEIIVNSIRHVTRTSLATVQSRWEDTSHLSDKLDVYFEETIIKSFELLQSSGDPEDLISGHNQAGKTAIAEAHKQHEALIAGILMPYASQIAEKGETVEQFTHFFVTTAMGFKAGATSRSDLDGLIESLKIAIAALIE